PGSNTGGHMQLGLRGWVARVPSIRSGASPQEGTMMTRSVLVGVLVAGCVAATTAPGGARTDERAAIDVTGTWRFRTNSPNVCFPSCVYHFKLVQEGNTIHGTDGTDPILGSLSGNEAVFTIHTGI